ncbi:MAG TPA: tRNA (cytidine(34)-2'-O)-methyltransferase [Tepidisphaeraceae bacterium]|nr:tRNA (cytidine(34)-2'-O)-methyltransferase [Tepidisphaeraceae bacterium]
MPDLAPHGIEVALVHPQIAPNTGNVARLCVATGTPLHLVKPLGFQLDDRQIRRSAMDYWPRLRLTLHDDLSTFREAMAARRIWLFDSSGAVGLWNAQFLNGDVLVFGSETAGLPSAWLSAETERVIRIPQVPGERCLNLATSVGIATYDAIRRVQVAE